MSDPVTEITWKDFDKAFEKPTGKRHRFRVRRYRGLVLDVEDVHFHFDSAVLMPDFETAPAADAPPSGPAQSPSQGPAGTGPSGDGNRVTGLAALRSAYLHAEANKAQKVLVTGHTDRSGSDAYNLTLSQKRADNVLHLLLGNRAGWVKVSDEKHQVEDVQQILQWAAGAMGWDCDPGRVDNVAGPKTSAATKKFQVAYNAAVQKTPAEWPGGGKIAEDGVVGPQTWGAFWDVYLHELAELLGTDAAGLASRQEDLAGRFVDGGRKAVGCGEHHPLTQNTVANRRSAIDRRVEILFFDAGEEPPLACHPSAGACDAKACDLYDPKRYALRPVPTDPVAGKTLVEPRIDVEYRVVLLDPDLAKHQDAKRSDGSDEAKIVADRATRIDVSARKSAGDAPYEKGGRLEVVEGPDRVKLFTDEALTKPLDRPLTDAELTREEPFPVWVAAEAEGAFKLKLVMDPPDDKRVVVREMEPVEMAVVRLDLKLHQLDEGELANLEFDAGKDTIDEDLAAMEAKALPQQKEMSEQEQVKPGRMLHAQKDGNHGRARLLVKKLTGTWPAGTDDYHVVVGSGGDSGGVKLFDAETAGAEKPLPHRIKVSDLKAADVELWVEGAAATKRLRDAVLDVGIDREEGGPPKSPKRRGDWARITVAQFAEVKLDYAAPTGGASAWDASNGRFFVNLKADPAGRKVKLVARLSEKLKDVVVHFTLAPHKDNGKSANWGGDLPATWKWKDVPAALKTDDRTDAKKLLHRSAKTDADGKAEIELTLSRFAGDVFEPAAYVTQDAHLAKYVAAHATLGKRKPVAAEKAVTVWRRIWYQMTKPKGFAPPQPAAAEQAYENVKTVLTLDQTLEFTEATAPARTFYPEYKVAAAGGSSETKVANIGDYNKNAIAALLVAKADQPVKRHLMVCAYQYDSKSGGVQLQDTAMSAPIDTDRSGQWIDVEHARPVFDPRLQGGSMVRSLAWFRSSDPATRHAIPAGDARIPKPRNNVRHIQVKLPAVAPAPSAGDPVFVVATVDCPAGPFLGESFNTRHTLIVFDPSDVADYNDTVVHEIGHSLNQTPRPGTQPGSPGIPDHPNQADRGQGNHCQVNAGVDAGSGETKFLCVMYDSGPMKFGLHRYCDVCHPYLLVEDTHRP